MTQGSPTSCVDLDSKTVVFLEKGSYASPAKPVAAEKFEQMEREAADMIMDPESWLEEKLSTNSYTGIVFYVGDWCKTCELYLKAINDLQQTVMSKAGCKMYAVCSEKQREVSENLRARKLSGYDAIVGDHVNSFAKYIRSRVDICPELVITECGEESSNENMTRQRYPHGATQPAVIFFVGKQNVFTWNHTPVDTVKRGKAPPRRPDPEEVWNQVSLMASHMYEKNDRGSSKLSKGSKGGKDGHKTRRRRSLVSKMRKVFA